jgi:hypothetical protein
MFCFASCSPVGFNAVLLSGGTLPFLVSDGMLFQPLQ